MLKPYLISLFESAMRLNRENILNFARASGPAAEFLDLGCDDGKWTMEVARAAQAKKVYGIEVVNERAEMARALSVDVAIANLDDRFPFADNYFDLVHANQVIEHVSDVDNFAAEVMRVLKPGGLAVVSTENGSSWHNIGAAALGWQAFSLTNVSKLQAGLGNPLSLMRNEPVALASWTHKVIFNYRGLKEFFALHGFTEIEVRGAGYYPLPSILGRLDVRHSHFITLAARKPK